MDEKKREKDELNSQRDAFEKKNNKILYNKSGFYDFGHSMAIAQFQFRHINSFIIAFGHSL